MHKPNRMLEVDVRDSLEWDRLLDDRRISVNAHDGNVTLTGSVPSYFDNVRATEDAWTVGGVKFVDNRILVGLIGTAVTDAQIAEACRDALDHERLVPKGSVDPSVTDGKVQLRGHVNNPIQRAAAEFAVDRVDGVLAVDNLISISPEPIPSDIASRITKALSRRAILDGSDISVANDGHTIFLTGGVPSYAAMREAVEVASAAPGVDCVINDLMIEP